MLLFHFILTISTRILKENMADQEASSQAGPMQTQGQEPAESANEKLAMMTKMTYSPSYSGNVAYKEKNVTKKMGRKKAHLRKEKKSNQKYGSVSKC